MIKRKIGFIVFVLCFCFFLMPGYVQATAATGTDDRIPEDLCTLTVSYSLEDMALSNARIKLYKVAEVSVNFRYELESAFASSGLNLNDIRTTGEWDVARSTLEAHILAYGIEPDATSITDQDGQTQFRILRPGMYLAIADEQIQNDLNCRFDSALIVLPGVGQDGHRQYQVSVNAKGEILPPVEPDGEIELKVLKLWRGDEGQDHRPQSIEAEILRDGFYYETVYLSEETNWSYTWKAEDDGASWMVVERNVPQGYTMTLEERGTTFVLTNTWTPEIPEDPAETPETGDTFNVLPYILLMTISGTMLIILGLTGKRKNV